MEAIFRILREGRPWKQTLPGYPPGKMVYWHYRNWVGKGVWAEVEGLVLVQAVGVLRRRGGD